MNNYEAPFMELEEIETEDVIMTSGVTLPEDGFDEDTTKSTEI